MAWDSSRPVPWRRLTREWAIYVVIMTVIFVVVFQDRSMAALGLGLLASLPLYLGLGYVLAKFGYQRKTLKELRAERPQPATPATTATPAPRPKPAPTKRTGGGTGRPGGTRKRSR